MLVAYPKYFQNAAWTSWRHSRLQSLRLWAAHGSLQMVVGCLLTGI